jgi:hypothetical protein
MLHAWKVAARRAQGSERHSTTASEPAQQCRQGNDASRTITEHVETDTDLQSVLDNTSSQSQYSEENRECIAKALYKPIEDWQTRIVRIRPGDESEILRLDIIIAAITEDPGVGLISEPGQIHYEALSYAWGDNAFTQSVMCNDVPFTITANLREALVHLRHTNGNRFFWVDALCINQYDLEEKARQIRKLHKLFKRASRVVVWLGQEAMHTQLALTWMYSFCLREHDSGSNAIQLARLCDLHALLAGLTNLMKRPWIRRIWILQEVHSARSVVVQCGLSEVSWDVFKRLSSCRSWVQERLASTLSFSKGVETLSDATPDESVTDIDDALRKAQTCMNVLAALTSLSHSSTGHSKMFSEFQRQSGLKRLVSLLKRTYMFQATDARDKVYALIGIAGVSAVSPGTTRIDKTPHLVIDYHPSVTEEVLFRRLLKLFASEIQDLTFLDCHTRTADSTTLPSWQPIGSSCSSIFRQLGRVVTTWAPARTHSLEPTTSSYRSQYGRLSFDAAEAFDLPDKLVLWGRKIETISSLRQVENSPNDVTDPVKLCLVGATERASSLKEVDEILEDIGPSVGVAKDCVKSFASLGGHGTSQLRPALVMR